MIIKWFGWLDLSSLALKWTEKSLIPFVPLIKLGLLAHLPFYLRPLSAPCRAIYHWMYHSFLALSIPRSGLCWSVFVILLSCHHCQQYPSCYHRIQTSIESIDKMIMSTNQSVIQDIKILKMH